MFSGQLIALIVLPIVYFSLAAAMSSGSPPVYKENGSSIYKSENLGDNEFLNGMRKTFIGGSVVLLSFALAALTGYMEFLLILSAASVYAGWLIRSELKRNTGGPLPWVATYIAAPLVYSLLNNRPMLLFDVWTIGISGFVALIAIASHFY